MLCAADAGPSIVVCTTCRLSTDVHEDGEGQRGGALLAQALRTAKAASSDCADIAVQDMACLFACKRHCVVHIRAPGRIGYVLGDFAPDAMSADAILTYARRHAASQDGVVRYADWPDGVKGHFIVRIPPEGHIVS